MSQASLYFGARVAVKTTQYLQGRRRFPGRVGTVDRAISPHEVVDGFWRVKLDATKERKARTEMFYGVDLEVIL